MARQASGVAGHPHHSHGGLRDRCRAKRAGALLALIVALFATVSPGTAVAAPAVPLTGAAVAVQHHGTHDGGQDHGGSHARGDHTACGTAVDAVVPQLLRDTVAERHAAHPGGGTALSGSVYVPRPRAGVRPLPDAPVADGDLLRAARHLGRSPPPPPGI